MISAYSAVDAAPRRGSFPLSPVPFNRLGLAEIVGPQLEQGFSSRLRPELLRTFDSSVGGFPIRVMRRWPQSGLRMQVAAPMAGPLLLHSTPPPCPVHATASPGGDPIPSPHGPLSSSPA